MANPQSSKKLKDIGTTALIKDNRLVFLYKKTEKLTTGLYLVTNLFPDQEPLKWSLRRRGMRLVSDMLPTYHAQFSENLAERATPTILELLTLLDIGLATGIISEMNHVILKREYVGLGNALEDVEENTDPYNALESKPSAQDVGFDRAGRNINKDIYRDEVLLKMLRRIDKGQNVLRTSTISENVFDRQSVKDIKNSLSEKHHVKKTFGRNTARRKDVIVTLFKKRDTLTVKDISLIIKGYSEKTIQRDLMVLVRGGILRKHGERRWSTYSLTQSS